MGLDKMKSIVLGTISINNMAGGLEKNIILLANYLSDSGYNVSLITFDLEGSKPFYYLNSKVKWYQVGRTKPHTSIRFMERVKLIIRIRDILKFLEKPTVICFHHGIIPRFFLSGIGLNIAYIGSERNSLSLYKHITQNKWSLGFVFLIFCRFVTVQFPSYIKDYPVWLQKKIVVIPNPVAIVNTAAEPDVSNENGRFQILTVGRLCDQKGQGSLIDAFSRIHSRYPLWDLYIIGDGSYAEKLKTYVVDKGMSNRVHLVGKQDNIIDWMRNSHIFCLPSKWEGFPNALAEAMSVGLPCVGYTQCAGVRELIDNDINGFLTSEAELSNALVKLIENNSLRKNMGEVSKSKILEFRPEKSLSYWNNILEKI